MVVVGSRFLGSGFIMERVLGAIPYNVRGVLPHLLMNRVDNSGFIGMSDFDYFLWDFF
jgi:hypothetical protein